MNSIETPQAVAPVGAEGASTEGRRLTAALPPASWNMIRLVPVADLAQTSAKDAGAAGF